MFTKRDLKKLILPLVIEQLLAVTIGMADTVMVASCGEAAVSGVSLVDSINILIISIMSALATGGAIVASQYLGRDDDEQANLASKQLILIVAAISTVLMIAALIGNSFILSAIFGKAEPAVMENSRIYFFYTALSYPFIGLYNAGAALFRAMGNSKVSMFTSIGMNVINLCGNALLIYGLKMGVAGAAIPTLVSRTAGALVILFLLSRIPGRIQLHGFHGFAIKPQMIKSILKIGVPSGLENGMFHLGKILTQGVVASFGTMAIAANAVGITIAALPQIPSNAIGLAMITVVGQCAGAGEYKQARSHIWRLTGLSYISLGVLSLLLILVVHPAVGIFDLSGETAELAVQMLIYSSICNLVAWPFSFTLPNGLRAAGDVRFTMTVSVLSMWIFRVGFSYLLAIVFNMGVIGVWVAMTIDWAARSAYFLPRLIGDRWTKRKVI